jgi:hypothetical protein
VGEEELQAAAFNFEGSVRVWSDYLQAHLHPRSLAPLAAFDHGHSEMLRWRDGAAVVRRQAERDESSSLVERVRRFLEESDTPQGFHCLFEADGGFGGLTHALLTEVRDDYCSAPCLSIALNTHRTVPRRTNTDDGAEEDYNLGEERADAALALCDTMALTSLADLRCCVVPLYDASSSTAARLYSANPNLPYHTSAPLAAMLECISLPVRTRRPRSSLTSLCQAVGTSTSTPLAAAALAMPSPPESELAASPVGPDWFVGLTPLQLAPRTVTAMGQFVSVLGQPNNAAAAQMAATLLPCRGGYTSAGGALWARPQPLLLPLSFPQFFAASLGRHGEVGGHRPTQSELLSLPTAAVLQSSPALQPLVSSVLGRWKKHKKAAAADGDLEADELTELQEQLEALAEAYADPAAEKVESDDEGDAEID